MGRNGPGQRGETGWLGFLHNGKERAETKGKSGKKGKRPNTKSNITPLPTGVSNENENDTIITFPLERGDLCLQIEFSGTKFLLVTVNGSLNKIKRTKVFNGTKTRPKRDQNRTKTGLNVFSGTRIRPTWAKTEPTNVVSNENLQWFVNYLSQ
jgi:hypothetical protein